MLKKAICFFFKSEKGVKAFTSTKKSLIGMKRCRCWRQTDRGTDREIRRCRCVRMRMRAGAGSRLASPAKKEEKIWNYFFSTTFRCSIISLSTISFWAAAVA
jgi:hypothetical protein